MLEEAHPIKTTKMFKNLLWPAFPIPSLSTTNHGLASLLLREQAYYLFALAKVMSKWKWMKPTSCITKSQLKWTADGIDELEREITMSYTQLFHNCFRHPAILPHCLSPRAVEACPSVGHPHVFQLAPCLENKPTVVVNSYSVIYPS